MRRHVSVCNVSLQSSNYNLIITTELNSLSPFSPSGLLATLVSVHLLIQVWFRRTISLLMIIASKLSMTVKSAELDVVQFHNESRRVRVEMD